MKKMLSTIIIASTVLACGKPKTKAIYKPWEVVNTESVTLKLLNEDSRGACRELKKSKSYCEDIIKQLKEETDFALLKQNAKDVEYKLKSDNIIEANDSLKFDNKETIYNITKQATKKIKITEVITFKSSYDGDEGYSVTFDTKQLSSFQAKEK